MTRRLTGLFLLVSSVLIQSGCAEAPPAEPEGVSSGADSVFSYVTTLRTDLLQDRFMALDRQSYVRHVRVEQLSREGDVIAYQEQSDRMEPERASEIHTAATDSGSFSFGVLGRFVSASELAPNPEPLVEYLTRPDPVFTSPRNRENFSYRIETDTMNGTQVERIEIEALRGSPHEIRGATLIVDPGTREIVGMSLRPVTRSLLFSEESAIAARLRRDASGSWVPATIDVSTRLRGFLGRQRHFRLHTVYLETG